MREVSWTWCLVGKVIGGGINPVINTEDTNIRTFTMDVNLEHPLILGKRNDILKNKKDLNYNKKSKEKSMKRYINSS